MGNTEIPRQLKKRIKVYSGFEELEMSQRFVQRYIATLTAAGEWIEYDRNLKGWNLTEWLLRVTPTSSIWKRVIERTYGIQNTTIAGFGSFTKAAEALGYTRSSISQMIASLENELGIKLLTRSRYGIKLTIEGAELFPFIERSIYQYRSMQEKADEIKGIETGVIRVGTISSVTCHWMPQLINGFKKEYPNVQFLFHQGDYTLIPEWIASGQIDFGFINPLAGTNLQTKTVKNGEMLAVLSKTHPLAKEKSIRLRDIAKEPYILLEEGNYSEPMTAFEAAGIQPNIQYTVHDDYAIMMMVEAGLGVSILAELILRRTNYDIVCLPVNPPVTRTLAVAFKDNDSLPIASKYFIDYLMEHKDRLP